MDDEQNWPEWLGNGDELLKNLKPKPCEISRFHEAQISNAERLEIIKIACILTKGSDRPLEENVLMIFDLYRQGRKDEAKD